MDLSLGTPARRRTCALALAAPRGVAPTLSGKCQSSSFFSVKPQRSGEHILLAGARPRKFPESEASVANVAAATPARLAWAWLRAQSAIRCKGLLRDFARAQREPGNKHNSILLAIVHYVIPLTIGKAVTVLHGNDRHDFASPLDVLPGYIRQSNQSESSPPTATRPAFLPRLPEKQSDREYAVDKDRCAPGAASSGCLPPPCANVPGSHRVPTMPGPGRIQPPLVAITRSLG